MVYARCLIVISALISWHAQNCHRIRLLLYSSDRNMQFMNIWIKILYFVLRTSHSHYYLNNSQKTSVAHQWGWGIGFFCEFKMWPEFCLWSCYAVRINVLYCTTIYQRIYNIQFVNWLQDNLWSIIWIYLFNIKRIWYFLFGSRIQNEAQHFYAFCIKKWFKEKKKQRPFLFQSS